MYDWIVGSLRGCALGISIGCLQSNRLPGDSSLRGPVPSICPVYFTGLKCDVPRQKSYHYTLPVSGLTATLSVGLYDALFHVRP